YQLFGKQFYKKIINSNKVAVGKSSLDSYSEIEKLVEENYNFTKYDSTIAAFRVKLLKNDWPFIIDGSRKDKSKLLIIASFEDSIAVNVLENKISRLDARLKLAEHYYSLKDLQSYVKELLALSEEFPIDNKILDDASAKLINAHQYNYVGNILERSYKIIPNVFNAKWLGIMNLSNNNNTSAIKYLEESKSLFGRDTQVLFNLTGAYMKAKNYNLAYQNIINCLVVDPNYSKAQEVKNQLEQLMKSK
ncbi:MAG: hypothetical protein KDC52_20140, partial [Ignavibacteriae bacterium]|nr:hypothetical protein [Ignavibacteriota bacterium]